MATVPGRFEASRMGHNCFIPNRLPPDLWKIAPRLSRIVDETTHALGRVDACRELIPNPDLLTFASLRIEAMASSTIENTIASPEELMKFEATHRASRNQVRLVSNYREALDEGVKLLAERPISVRLLLELHEILMAGAEGQGHAGRLKTKQNFIGGSKTDTIENAVFVPPPPEQTEELLHHLEEYINLEQTEARVIQVALTHYQFETIHPFGDGNGRLGRLLIILQLIQQNLLSSPLIYPSVYFEKTRDEYYARLQAVRTDSDWEGWIVYFLSCLKEQAQASLALVSTIRRLQERLAEGTSDVRRSASSNKVISAFFRDPYLTVKKVVEITHLAPNTVKSVLEALESDKIVVELTGRRRSRVYTCLPLMGALFGHKET